MWGTIAFSEKSFEMRIAVLTTDNREAFNNRIIRDHGLAQRQKLCSRVSLECLTLKFMSWPASRNPWFLHRTSWPVIFGCPICWALMFPGSNRAAEIRPRLRAMMHADICV